MAERTRLIARATGEQFAGILLTPPEEEGILRTASGRSFLRLKFRIWPGRGAPIETVFKQEVVQALRTIEPAYADWMVAINYEVEKRSIAFDRVR
jgi:small conductance mechanosensitive channel